MKQTRAERITGADIYQARPDHWVAHDGVVIAEVTEPDKAKAMDILVARAYSFRAKLVMERAGWKCEYCGKIGPLQVHHKVYRAHGRDDRPENLIACDAECHEREHKKSRGLKTIEVENGI